MSDSLALIIAIAFMVVLTYILRALPFVLMAKHKPGNTHQGKWLVLGPVILVSIATVVLASDIQQATQLRDVFIYLASLLSAYLLLRLFKNTGAAVLLAMLVYGLLLFLVK